MRFDSGNPTQNRPPGARLHPVLEICETDFSSLPKNGKKPLSPSPSSLSTTVPLTLQVLKPILSEQ